MLFKNVSLVACVILLVIMILYISVQYRKNSCPPTVTSTITGIGKGDSKYDYSLRDYYIKSSYNSCSTGQFKNDWVNLCALTNIIKQGCRVLDFEIYMVDGKAVVATSNSTNFTQKGTYNSIPIDAVINHVALHAVSNSLTTDDCPNSFDPLILHFRIKSTNSDVYTQLADSLVAHLDSKLLPNKYSYENHGHNLGIVPIKEMLGKVIIIVDKVDGNTIRGTKMEELVNILGNSAFLRSLSYNDIAHTPDMAELKSFTAKNMAIGFPNLSYKSSNYNSSITMQYGVQMNCMCFQTNDSYLQAYNKLFDTASSAFILKPSGLRYTPRVIADPAPPDPALSAGYKTHSSNYYNFNL